MRPHECPHRAAKMKGKHGLPPVVTGVDQFALNPWKISPIYQHIATDHSPLRSAQIIREQEVRSSNLRAPTIVSMNYKEIAS